MEFSCEMERKRFDSEQERIRREDAAGTRNLVAGTLIVIAGFGAAAYLAVQNQQAVALSITGPLTALVAVVIGRRILS